jgi:hypothetical protein
MLVVVNTFDLDRTLFIIRIITTFHYFGIAVVIKNHHHIDFIIGFIKATAIAITMD